MDVTYDTNAALYAHMIFLNIAERDIVLAKNFFIEYVKL